jgi:chemotaxis protein methyltransferase CheR
MSISTPDFDYIRTMVREQAAIVLETGKEYLVEARIAPLAIREGLASLHDLVEVLRKDPSNGLRKKVVDAMTTNETFFFRDIEPFEVIKKHIIPELIESRAATRKLSLWCGASSTGQEPYSVAVMLREHFPQLATWDISYLATDISMDVLEKAKSGRYNQLEVNRGLPVTYLVKYFQKQGVEWEVKESIRRMITFKEMNLIKPWPAMPPQDIVMLRNVLIYFDVDTKKTILRKIREILRPDGYLFLGGAETTLNLDEKFVRVPFERAGCYRLVK